MHRHHIGPTRRRRRHRTSSSPRGPGVLVFGRFLVGWWSILMVLKFSAEVVMHPANQAKPFTVVHRKIEKEAASWSPLTMMMMQMQQFSAFK